MLKFDAGRWRPSSPTTAKSRRITATPAPTLEHGEPVNPEREGYKFLGWFESATGGTAVTEFTFPQTANAEKTYYAQWEKETYTVTFRYNGGTLEGADHKEVACCISGQRDRCPRADQRRCGIAELDRRVHRPDLFRRARLKDREVKANTIYSANWNLPSYQVTFGNLGDDANQHLHGVCHLRQRRVCARPADS